MYIVKLSQGNLFFLFLIGSLDVMHELIFTVASIIQISSINLI